jgi:predicted amidohydrolase YtcJ
MLIILSITLALPISSATTSLEEGRYRVYSVKEIVHVTADWADVTWPIGPEVVSFNYNVTKGSEYVDYINVTGLSVHVVQKCLDTPGYQGTCGFIVIEIEALVLGGSSKGKIMIESGGDTFIRCQVDDTETNEPVQVFAITGTGGREIFDLDISGFYLHNSGALYPKGPERAFVNGTVITMDEVLPVAEAVLIQDENIIAVGSDEEISSLVGDEADIIDLQGRTLLPGFIDAHSHWLNELVEVDSIEAAINMSIRHGWTTISSLFTYPELIDELLGLDEQGEIRNRVNLYLRLSWQDQRWTEWYKDYPPGEMLTPMIRVAGVKMFADGGLGSGTAAFSEPYPDDPNNYGSLFFTQEALDQLVNETHGAGYQIAIHAIGDAAIEQVLNAYEAVLGDESNEHYRHRIEHVLFLRDDLIERMASKNIIASFQNHWATSDYYDWYVDIVGAERISLLARWRDLLDSGVLSAASTDYPYCTYGATAVHGLFSSVTRIGPFWELEPPDSLLAQRLKVEEALRLITIDAAYAISQENFTGSITPGKYADLVVLSGNPFEVQPEELIDLTVWMTVVGGNIKYWRENPGTYTLSLDVEGPGNTQLPPGEYWYPRDSTLDFIAYPGSPTTDDAEFSHWLLDGENMGSMDSISITMDSDHDLILVFFGTSEAEPEPESETEPEPEPETKSEQIDIPGFPYLSIALGLIVILVFREKVHL